MTYVPIILGVSNVSPSSLRNIFIELTITADSRECSLVQLPRLTTNTNTGGVLGWFKRLLSDPSGGSSIPQQVPVDYDPEADLIARVNLQIGRFDPDRLQKVDNGWRILIEWEALQPERLRVVKPILYVSAPLPTIVNVNARVFADSIPAPFTLSAKLNINTVETVCTVRDLLPNFSSILESMEAKDSNQRKLIVTESTARHDSDE